MKPLDRRGKPPACEWLASPVHSLTYARLHTSGWWCDRHAPSTWPTHRQPSPGTSTEAAAPTGAEPSKDHAS
ncbi:hypothetical protein ACIPSJ_01700 [Streptomyces sp. NPDC090088]|uniref:hypothetical protein n=1 Tax=Streptomyces sp. NPDC090088 TaxID=3365944 RepID=UPI00381FDC3D